MPSGLSCVCSFRKSLINSVCHIGEGVYLCWSNIEGSNLVSQIAILSFTRSNDLRFSKEHDWFVIDGCASFCLPTLQSIINTEFCSILFIFFVSFHRNMMKPDGTLHRDTFQSTQPSQPWSPPRNPCSISPGKRSLGPYRIPIIPSVHSHQDETSCMQTISADGMHQSLPRQVGTGGRADNPVANPLCDRVGEKWKVGVCVPEEVREKLKANTNMKQDDIVFSNPHVAKETVCILLANGAGHGGTAPSGPTETQLVYPRDIQKDFTQPRQWEVLCHTLCLENKAAECFCQKSMNGSLRNTANSQRWWFEIVILFFFWKSDSLKTQKKKLKKINYLYAFIKMRNLEKKRNQIVCHLYGVFNCIKYIYRYLYINGYKYIWMKMVVTKCTKKTWKMGMIRSFRLFFSPFCTTTTAATTLFSLGPFCFPHSPKRFKNSVYSRGLQLKRLNVSKLPCQGTSHSALELAHHFSTMDMIY